MSLAAGTRLGPYEILAPLGAGGMGEVYRARDTRLGRSVAIKVLPQGFARDPERLRRFETEARAASGLADPHIVTVHDVGKEGAVSWIATELVEGATLRSLLGEPLPLRRALDLASQIAAGLAAAHEKGIVHRDLKPENILIGTNGLAKIADFGLAKLSGPAGGRDSQIPTSDGRETTAGVVMGTVAYMSPEQARGSRVDFGSDQFSFGLIVYEILTGRHPFRRESPPQTLSAIIEEEPEPLGAVRSGLPSPVSWILERCLSKDPEQRYASTRDLARELSSVREHLPDLLHESGAGGEPGERRASPARFLPWTISGALFVVAAFLGIARLRSQPKPAPARAVRFALYPPEGEGFLSRFDAVDFALSPDGSKLAFVADPAGSAREVAETGSPSRKIWIRSLADLEARPLAGTDGATALFWSPDGRSLGFSTETQLKRIELSGGSAAPICDLPFSGVLGGTWGAGAILFGIPIQGVIYRVSPDGGEVPRIVVRPEPARGETRAMWPLFLPDGRTYLYLIGRKDGSAELMLSSPEGPPRALGPISSRVEFAEPGLLVFAQEGGLFAQRFDLHDGRLSGPLIPVAPSVHYFYTSKWASFSVSQDGTLAYGAQGNISRLTWFDRSGRRLSEVGASGVGDTISIAISRDGTKALFDRTRPDYGTYNIWMIDLTRGVESRVTSDQWTDFSPVWLPDGKHIVYSVAREYVPRLVRRDLAGGAEEPLLPPGKFQEAQGVTPDGSRLIFSQAGETEAFGLWSLPLDGNRAPTPLITSKDQQEIGRLSPDGKYLAYISNESGRPEAYLVPMSALGDKTRLSANGALLLQWGRDGREIFYTSPDGRLYSVPVTTSPSLRVEEARALFLLPAGGWSAFDVAPDGKFLAAVQQVSAAAAPREVVVDWTSQFSR